MRDTLHDATRTRRASTLAALTAACAFAPSALAQTQPTPGPSGASITLEQARSAAASRAPDVLVAAARAGFASSEVGVAGALANPTLLVGSALNSAHFYTAISVPLPIFGQQAAAVEAAEALAVAARRDIDVTRLDVRMATTLAWVDAWLAAREAEIAASSATRSARLLAVTQERFETGTAPRLDVLRARAEALRQAADAEASSRLVASASARLSVWLGRAVDAPSALDATGEPPGADNVASVDALLARIDRHPALAAARARIHAADAGIALERRRRWPIVGVEIGSSFFDPTFVTAPGQPTPGFSDGHVALSFEVPVFNAHGALIARAQTAASQSQLESQVARARLASDVMASYASLAATTTRERAQTHDVLPATQEAADLALEGYQAGRGDITAVLAAQQALADAHRVAVQLEAERARALATLEHAIGGPL